MLFGCGGGGGGGGAISTSGATPPPPPVAAAPLALTSTNADAAVLLAFGYGDTALSMAQLAVDWTAQVDDGAPFSKACPGGGTLRATLADRDGDHRASAGDQVTVTIAGCFLKEVDDTMDGQVTVTLTAPAATQQRAGLVTFSGFKVKGSTAPVPEITGALRFDYTAGRLSKLVHVYSDSTQPFGMTFSDGTKSVSDTITALDAQYETRLDTVRATSSMRFHVASNMLGGSFDVTTPTTWSAWFDTYPDAGEMSLVGANNGKASLRAVDSSADILLNGTRIEGWSLDGTGMLWSGAPWLPQVAGADHYDTQQPGTSGAFKVLIQPDPARFVPNGSLAWLFSRPIDPKSITSAKFMQTSSTVNGSFTPVTATVSLEGGLLTVTPSTQLQPGAGYNLQFFGNYGSTLLDTAGEMFSFPSFAGTVAQTIGASLVSNGPPVLLGTGATLVLDASGSAANGLPVASIRWRQLSGPALTFSDQNAALVTVSPAGSTNGIAVVEVEVANAAGDIDRKQMSLTVAADTADALVIGHRTAAAPLAIASNVDPAYGTSYVKDSSGNTVLDVLLVGPDQLRFLSALQRGATWQPGLKLTYDNSGTSAANGGLVGCASGNNTGNFSVLDYALDGSANVVRLALDFDDTCGSVVTQGSIRYNSTIPVRP